MLADSHLVERGGVLGTPYGQSHVRSHGRLEKVP